MRGRGRGFVDQEVVPQPGEETVLPTHGGRGWCGVKIDRAHGRSRGGVHEDGLQQVTRSPSKIRL